MGRDGRKELSSDLPRSAIQRLPSAALHGLARESTRPDAGTSHARQQAVALPYNASGNPAAFATVGRSRIDGSALILCASSANPWGRQETGPYTIPPSAGYTPAPPPRPPPAT